MRKTTLVAAGLVIGREYGTGGMRLKRYGKSEHFKKHNGGGNDSREQDRGAGGRKRRC